jgi:predicted metal-dependent HD superfamily phosphohydrolase
MSRSTAAPAWVAAVVALGGSPDAAADAAVDLQRRYAEPHRSYHTTAHVDAVVGDCALLGADVRLDVHDRAVVALAACAHDVVYDAQPGADELASAAWARTWLTRSGVAPAVIDRVAELVLATTTHTAAPGDAGAAVLLDADLAILGATPDEYAGYVAAVRREYAAFSDDDWRTGRARVLAALAERERLYLTEPAHHRWERQARRNLGDERAGLAR